MNDLFYNQQESALDDDLESLLIDAQRILDNRIMGQTANEVAARIDAWLTHNRKSQLDRIEKKLDSLIKPKQKKINGVPVARRIYDATFEEIWKLYPPRTGSNPKHAAYNSFNARVKEGSDKNDILEGVKRYAEFCKATGVSSQYIMQASRFLGRGEEYRNKWAIPAPETIVVRIPTEINALVTFARERGIEAKPGESTFEFRQRVENSI